MTLGKRESKIQHRAISLIIMTFYLWWDINGYPVNVECDCLISVFSKCPQISEKIWRCNHCKRLWSFHINYRIYNSVTKEEGEEGEVMPKAYFTWDQVSYKLKFEFGGRDYKTIIEPTLSLLKGTIPSSDRDFDYDKKEWFIKEEWKDFILALLYAKFGQPNVVFWEKPAETHSYVPATKDIQAELLRFSEIIGHDLKALEKLSLKEVLPLYRKACFRYHPDRNPDGAFIMSELNSLWTSLKDVEKGYFK